VRHRVLRGPGSNQHQDKPPVAAPSAPPCPDKAGAAGAAAAAAPFSDGGSNVASSAPESVPAAQWEPHQRRFADQMNRTLRQQGLKRTHRGEQVIESREGLPAQSTTQLRTQVEGLSDDVSVVQYTAGPLGYGRPEVRTEVHLGHDQVPDGVPRHMKADSRQEMDAALSAARQTDFEQQKRQEFRANAFKYAPPPRPGSRPPRDE